jgi:biopolymer transport protein ExbD
MSRLRKKYAPPQDDIELNVMPFIDVFSLLCTFLLFTAVFISIGIHVIQVPFLSNATSNLTSEKKEIKDIKLQMSQGDISLMSTFPDFEKKTYALNAKGLKGLHEDLITLKGFEASPDKIDLYTDEDVLYEHIVLALDAIKTMTPQEQKLHSFKTSDLYQKVILSSVIL